MAEDILAHLTFTFNWFPKTHLMTPLNGALWTLAVEMQFYLIFPFLARSFQRRPLFTYGLMAGVAWAFRAYAMRLASPQMLFNQMPAFLDVYANGFVAAVIYKELKSKANESPWVRNLLLFSLLAAVAALYTLVLRQSIPTDYTLIQQGQMRIRFMQSVYSAVVIIAVSLGPGLVRVIFGNKLTYFLSSVSMQFYIYHQVLAVRLKKWGIPASVHLNPNQAGDRVWQRSYTALSLLLAFVLAVALTYLFERPISKRLRK
jgi:peptidoglycan/LPS O-acetylase OafA/YrhL